MRVLAFLALAVYSLPGFAWGPEGHRLVARMAQEMLTPAAADRVQATLEPGETIASLASWADEVRKTRKETEPWHFIDIPIDSAGLDMKRDCPPAGCVIGKIAEFRTRWRDPALPPAARREALLFLVHFVGDMHQPLHCANDHDRGGNDVTVEFEGKRMNLHHLWDSALLDRLPPEDQLFVTLSRAITPAERAGWARGSVEDWAGESFAAARLVVYGDLPGSRRVGEAYEGDADPVVERQLEKAAVRLAAILNETP
jgi:hypothetical protein